MSHVIRHMLARIADQPGVLSQEVVQSTARMALIRIERMETALKLIAVVDQGCGGTLTAKEMADSAMRQAAQALEDE